MTQPARKPHPADGKIAYVEAGGGALLSLSDPRSFAGGGLEWITRYGNVASVRYAIASVLCSYDHLLSDSITQVEAIRRLRLLRAARKNLAATPN